MRTVRVWWRLLPHLVCLSLLGWFGFQACLRVAAIAAPANAFVALFIVSAGLLSVLAATVACLAIAGRLLHMEELSPEVRVTQPVLQQVAVTILPFLGIYAVFNTVQRAADRLVTNAVLVNGLGSDGLTDKLNPLSSLENGVELVVIVVVAYLVRRGLDLLHERTGIGALGLGAAFIEGFFMLLVILSGSKLLATGWSWLGDRAVAGWLQVPWDGLRAVGDLIRIDLPQIVADAWTFVVETAWPAVVTAVGAPVLWLAVAALVYGTGVLSLAELWRKGRPLTAAVPLTRRQQRRAHLAEARLATGSGRGRRLGLELSEAFLGDVDDKYLPTLQSLRLILKAGVPTLSSLIVLYAVTQVLGDLVEAGFVLAIGGRPLTAWLGLEVVAGALRVAVVEPLRVSLLAVTFGVCLERFRAQAGAAAPLPAAEERA